MRVPGGGKPGDARLDDGRTGFMELAGDKPGVRPASGTQNLTL